MNSKWIVRAYNENAGGLRWQYSTFQTKVFHPSCPDLLLGFACAHESCLRSDGNRGYSGKVYSEEEFLNLVPKIRDETIARALQKARENLAKLKNAEDYAQHESTP